VKVSTLDRKSLLQAASILAARDKELASIFTAYGPPPMWARKPGFETLVRIVLEQQVSLVSARSMFHRLNMNIEPFVPERFIELGEPYLRSLGVTRQKASYLVHLAFAEKEISLLGKMSDEDAHAALLSIKGVGPWTANIYLLMALKRPDIWPSGDVALTSAVARLKELKARPNTVELARIAEAWRPFRSVAARMLWQYYLAERDRNHVW
jgi:DNA-3-methyladenine glycosylase II